MNKSIYLLLWIVLSSNLSNAQTNSVHDLTLIRTGVKLKSKFFMANGKGPFPTVMLLHGFPGNEHDVLGLGEKLSQSGMNALVFNYSGTFQSEGNNSFSNTQKDIKSAYEFLHQNDNISKYRIDTNKIILGGYSYGGGMALTFAATHQGIKSVFSIAGTDHGEFMREYIRNEAFQKMIDGIFDNLTAANGPVRSAKGSTPKEIAEIGIDKLLPIYDLRKMASPLSQRNIMLIGGWDDKNVTIENHILPLYRALQKEDAKNLRIVSFQDDHAFGKVRSELAQSIMDWISDINWNEF